MPPRALNCRPELAACLLQERNRRHAAVPILSLAFDVNKQDLDGNTPLLFAIHRKGRVLAAAAACPICGLAPSLYIWLAVDARKKFASLIMALELISAGLDPCLEN